MADDTDAGHQYYVKGLMESRSNVREAIALASERFDPKTFRRPEQAIKARETNAILHVRMHTALMDYYDQIVPYHETLGSFWEESFYTIEVGSEEREISLSDLDEYRHQYQTEVQETNNGPKGRQQAEVRFRVLLPLEVVIAAYTQLNKCANELEFIPQRVEGKRAEIDKELVDDFNEWYESNVAPNIGGT